MTIIDHADGERVTHDGTNECSQCARIRPYSELTGIRDARNRFAFLCLRCIERNREQYEAAYPGASDLEIYQAESR